MVNYAYRQIVQWVMRCPVYKWFLLRILPFVRFSMYYTKMRGDKYHEGYAILKPGDVVLTVDKKKLTTKLVPGTFTHASFCLGMDCEMDEYEIAEMTHDHYTKSHFYDLCKEADRVVIMRCPDFSYKYIDEMVTRCKSFEGATYDTEFTLGVEALYCSELCYQVDVDKLWGVDLVDLAGLGRPYVSPDGFHKAKGGEVVWDSEWDPLRSYINQ